jgi:crotonobetainyl-CoA:carnitine CoA-transferase CaiB-like acyl-CoA transferase
MLLGDYGADVLKIEHLSHPAGRELQQINQH